MNATPSAWTLCVDFGTAYSKAAAVPTGSWARFRPGLVRPLILGGHEAGGNAFLLASAVFVDDDRILFGGPAIARADALAQKKRMALRSFKTLLSVSDLERALNTSAPLSIDPHRMFAMRDLIVLYLSYLTAAIGRAVATDAMLSQATQIDARYAAPAWRSGDSAGLHRVVVALFGEAEAVSAALGPAILDSAGIGLDAARRALESARAAPHTLDMGLIFEATAAAAYTSIGIASEAPALIVVDMGAGTTDIAGMARAGARIEELPDARVTLKQAGDFIDRVIVNIAIEASPALKTPAQQSALWRALMASMRDFKETLFAEGRAAFRHNGRVISISMRDIERDADFRLFMASLSEAYAYSLEAARAYAAMHGGREIQAVAVGGGAHAPFIQQLMRAKPRGGKVRVAPRPATPDWAHASEFRGNLAPVFPQLAIAIGGALAPESMLSARAISPAAAVRSDSLAEPD